MIIRPAEADMFYVDRQAEKHDEANTYFKKKPTNAPVEKIILLVHLLTYSLEIRHNARCGTYKINSCFSEICKSA